MMRPSEDCISRQALIDEILEDGNGAVLSYTTGMDEDDLVERIERQMIQHFIGVIKYAPSVEPERPKGEWIKSNEHKYECPFCHVDFGNFGLKMNYCPNCGCTMTKGGDTE